ncbi:hypothetical protein EK21DRAFT_104781 [Setomelanomma holmii]|uniref:Uncharacterized protein n=1 Tax=Setomelanomma holmii TaxID=210430 RepID=A0A9P4GYC0_9PLEO|nr:hypothetical protein EK21DRAFT_104781 [Setomelanomma holmii]
MLTSLNLVALSSLLFSANAATLARRAVRTATVFLAIASGTPAHLASGFIYSIPDNGTSISIQIPDELYTDFGFDANRAGSAQLVAPSRGWAYGSSEYTGRWESTLSNYRASRKFGADFIMLVHDMWGVDWLTTSIMFPGDDGDWSSFEAFTDRLIANIKSNGPGGKGFWNREFSQYTACYVRVNAKCRLDSSADPQFDLVTFNNFRTQYGTPERPIDINEYGAPDKQSAPASVWHISRFERHNIRGLRGKWASYGNLHDFTANVLGKDGSTYFSNRDCRVATSSSANNLFDVLAGNRRNTNTYDITITGLISVGLPSSGTVKIRTRRFNWTGQYSPVMTVDDLGIVEHTYTNDAVTFWITPDKIETAYAFEFVH